MKEVDRLISQGGLKKKGSQLFKEQNVPAELDKADQILKDFLNSKSDIELKIIIIHSLFIKYSVPTPVNAALS